MSFEIISQARKIEQLLKERGFAGRGIRARLEAAGDSLPQKLVEDAKAFVQVRNMLTHVEDVELSDRSLQRYIKLGDSIIWRLDGSPNAAVSVPVTKPAPAVKKSATSQVSTKAASKKVAAKKAPTQTAAVAKKAVAKRPATKKTSTEKKSSGIEKVIPAGVAPVKKVVPKKSASKSPAVAAHDEPAKGNKNSAPYEMEAEILRRLKTLERRRAPKRSGRESVPLVGAIKKLFKR